MKRGIILGVLGFAAAFVAERQLTSIKKDVQRYNRLRSMSNEGPLSAELAGKFGSSFSNNRAHRPGGAKNLLSALASDAIRYARIRAM